MNNINSLKRLSPVINPNFGSSYVEMEEDLNGEYVSFEAFEKLNNSGVEFKNIVRVNIFINNNFSSPYPEMEVEPEGDYVIFESLQQTVKKQT